METQGSSPVQFGVKETFIGLLAGLIVALVSMTIAIKFPAGYEWGAFALFAACIGFAIDWKQYQGMLTSVTAGYTFGLGVVAISKYGAVQAIWPFLAGITCYELGVYLRPRKRAKSL